MPQHQQHQLLLLGMPHQQHLMPSSCISCCPAAASAAAAAAQQDAAAAAGHDPSAAAAATSGQLSINEACDRGSWQNGSDVGTINNRGGVSNAGVVGRWFESDPLCQRVLAIARL
ncbi:hypothetical protein CMV_001137 [Castanea mollissima]|uniref:Uncharacterized protein n=1 Tax=Castanea mollissima TaxID=60419 RepID=A0A8J4RS48_9ROSI|nr:hypothetical protein CMV_001137 [Castanea mollissima]